MFSTLCEAHYIERRNRMSPGAKRGVQVRRAKYPDRFPPPGSEKYWANQAHRLVASAIRQGLLPDLKGGEYACVDCSAVATVYEHRDYSRPLDVEPTCETCNFRRGTAKWPEPGRYQFKRLEQSNAA